MLRIALVCALLAACGSSSPEDADPYATQQITSGCMLYISNR